MAYNRENFLRRVIDIQDITLQHTQRGVTQKYVYENYIKDQFRICKSSFDKYMCLNARRELRTLKTLHAVS